MNFQPILRIAALVVLSEARAQAQTPPAPPLLSPQVKAPVAAPITVTVRAGGRQSFGGFGASLGNWDGTYQKLSPPERLRLSRALWHDLNFKTLRLWFNTDSYAPTPNARDLSEFRRQYLDSHLIADARAQGVTTLLLAPDHLPAWMKAPPSEAGTPLRDDAVEAYATLLAEFIARLKTEFGITLDVTGVQNEPNIGENISPAQMVAVTKHLRRELDRRGLESVQIIAPETASADDALYSQLEALRADADAWRALSGIASHSYNMAATDRAASFVAGVGGGNAKNYWMTEASDNGPEMPGNHARAASLATRFLSDMNHRVTHWVHFLGFETDDPKDNATRILAYTPAPLRVTSFQKYHFYRQLSRAFDVGAVFRDSASSLEGDMLWTYGLKPRVTAAAARNPDGSWSIGLANFTSDSFLGVQGWSADKWNREQGGHTPAQTFPITLRIEELQNSGPLVFRVQRSGAPPNQAAQTVTLRNGRLSLQIAPLELVTLRSLPLAPAKTAAKKR